VPKAPTDPARHAAFWRIAEQAELFPELTFDGPTTSGLSSLDAAFAHAIYDAVIRRWFTLEYIVRGALDGDYDSLEPPVKSALLGGVAQLLLLDRVPMHAAVNESVNWAKWARSRGAGGLVNAVLRRVVERVLRGHNRRIVPQWRDAANLLPLGDGTALDLGDVSLPEDPLERVAVATGHPLGLLKSWAEQFGHERMQSIALHDLMNPPTIINIGANAPEHVNCFAHERSGHGVFQGSREELTAVLAQHPDIWVQDPASSGAIESIAHLKPKLILDLCAGQGTKTRQLARTFPHARIIAGDTDRRRLARLSESIGQKDRVTISDLRSIARQQNGTADLILLDVPCTNTGVLARRVEARYRWGAEQTGRMISTQREILANAELLLKPGGAILYATCSLERDENESIIDWAASSGRFNVSEVRREFPSGGPGSGDCAYTDGAFSALLTFDPNPKRKSRKA
jgi:16S rRNA (cytosine967-C5)-methyltransferase